MATAKQYTIRGVPAAVDDELRKRARRTGKSFNQVVIEALREGTGSSAHDDLDFMIGTMTDREAARVEREILTQRRVDKDLWR